jgi:hypothetical protein
MTILEMWAGFLGVLLSGVVILVICAIPVIVFAAGREEDEPVYVVIAGVSGFLIYGTVIAAAAQLIANYFGG